MNSTLRDYLKRTLLRARLHEAKIARDGESDWDIEKEVNKLEALIQRKQVEVANEMIQTFLGSRNNDSDDAFEKLKAKRDLMLNKDLKEIK